MMIAAATANRRTLRDRSCGPVFGKGLGARACDPGMGISANVDRRVSPRALTPAQPARTDDRGGSRPGVLAASTAIGRSPNRSTASVGRAQGLCRRTRFGRGELARTRAARVHARAINTDAGVGRPRPRSADKRTVSGTRHRVKLRGSSVAQQLPSMHPEARSGGRAPPCPRAAAPSSARARPRPCRSRRCPAHVRVPREHGKRSVLHFAHRAADALRRSGRRVRSNSCCDDVARGDHSVSRVRNSSRHRG